MDRLEKARRLKAMLSQIAPRGEIESVPKQPLRADLTEGLEGLEAAPEPNVNVDSGLRKLAEDRSHEVTASELDALEAIMMPANRPVVFVRGDSYDNVGPPWTGLNVADVKARISALLPMIGRIEVPNSPLIPYAGTGFVVGKNLVMTNRHVAALFTQGLGLRIRYQAGDAAVDFKRQMDSSEDDRSRVSRCEEWR